MKVRLRQTLVLAPLLAALAVAPVHGQAPGAGGVQARIEPVRVRFDTALGPFEVELDPARAPVTAANFLKYVDGGFYDGGQVHRSARLETQAARPVKIEVIQAGINPARRAESFPAIPLERTSVTGILHKDGTISMARSGPDTATSDFFICMGDQPSLDFGGARNSDGQGFAAFGRVVFGMDVARAIHKAPAEGETLSPPVRLFRAMRLRADEAPSFDAASEVLYFSGEQAGFPVPDYRLAEDPTNRFIIGAALTGITMEDLQRRGIDDAAQRVETLVRGRFLILVGSTCRLPFPVISGEPRQALKALVEARVAPVVPRVAAMLDRLAQAAGGRRDVLFHLVWSRVMDKFWWKAWQATRPGKTGATPRVAWAIRPPHPYQVGTNYDQLPGKAEIAVTWGRGATAHIKPIMNSAADLERMARGIAPADPGSVEALSRAGCLDGAGRLRALAYREGGALDKLTRKLARDYAAAVATLYEYDALAPQFAMAPGQFFVVVHHETAYAIYDALIAQGRLPFPSALRDAGDPAACAQLVSLQLDKRPPAR
jgi:peptidyl-prolyl cis-trans isomerase A (cyclophilin A)